MTTHFELSEDQLQTVSAGAASKSTTSSKSTKNNGLFEVEDFSFDIEQVSTIGSATSGAGAGKVTFNPF